jgi:hypothetical protein
LEKPAVSSVAGLRPTQPSLASNLAAPKAEIKQAAPQENVSVIGSQGKLLIPEPKVPSLEKFNVLSPTWYNPDINPKVDVQETVKNLTLKNKELTSNYKQYKKGKEELNAEIEQLNYLSTNPANRPFVLAKQKEIEAKSLQLDNTFKQLSSEAEQAKNDEASLNRAMVRNAADKAKQGSWGGAIWNSFVEGYKSSGRGAVRNTSNALIELFDAIGLPYAADKKMTKDEAKKNIINEFIPIIEKGYDVAKSKGTTAEFIEEKKKGGDIPTALLGLAQSAPIMASGGYGSFVNGALQTYDGVVRGMDDDPFTATMTENEKNTLAMPIALIGGILENYGFRTVLGKSKPALLKFSSYVISKIPKNAGIQAITNAVETAAKSKIGKAILAGGRAYLGEAETGGAQSLAEVGIKELYDQIQGVDLFKSPTLFKDIAYKALEDAHVEGLGGLMMKGMAGGIQMTVGGVKNKMDDASYKLWSDMMNDDEQVSIYKAQIQSDLANNKITKEEAQIRMDEANIARGILSKIPSDLSTRNQREAFALISEKEKLTDAIAGKDPSLVSKQTDRIKQIDEQLKQISNAVQEQTTSQIPVQPEAGARVQMAEGEPKAEPQVSSEKSKREEIERRRKEDIDRYDERDKNSLESITPKNPNHPIVQVGMQFNQGMKVVPVSTKASDNFNNKEGSYEAITKIIEPAEVDSEGKMTKAAKIEITLFNNKAEADAAIKANFEKIQSQTGKKQQEINAKYDAELAALESQVLAEEVKAEEVDLNQTFKEAGEQAKSEQKDDAIRNFILSNGKVGDTITLSDGTGYSVTEVKDVKNGKEITLVPFEMVDGKMELNYSGTRLINNSKVAKVGDLFETSYTNTKGERVTEQYTYNSVNTQNENIQAKTTGAKVVAEEATVKTDQAQQGAAEQPVQASNKRGEIKSSLERLKDAGILRSAITGRKDISQGEIDSQMALTDAMANVWKETTGRDDFYENFFNDVSEGDIDAIMEKGGVLFQNIELPQRPLTRVSLGVFDLPEFKRMEGQEVSINSVKDLARTRGKQIEKELMQTVLDYDKYQDVKKISFDEFKSDVEMQVMKLEKVRSSTYADYGMGNLGFTDIYGGRMQASTTIYNSPVDHGQYGHFPNDFKSSSILPGTTTFGSSMSWNDWEVKQIPGTEQYVAIDKSMPSDVSQDQISNYIGTAGSKEAVEKWIEERKNYEADINVGLFGHTRGWYSGKGPYYLSELQSDYFQKNDPNYLYLPEINAQGIYPNAIATDKYNDEYIYSDVEKLKKSLNVEIEVEYDSSNILNTLLKAYIYKPNGEKLVDFPIATKRTIKADDKFNAQNEYMLLYDIKEIINGNKMHENKILQQDLLKAFQDYKDFIRGIKYDYNEIKKEILENERKIVEKYELDIVRKEAEKIKNSEKGASIRKQFIASQKIHEIRLLKEAFRSAAQEGAEVLRFPTPYTLAVIEGFVNKSGETGAPYEIINGDPERLRMGDTIDYGGTEMTVLDTAGDSFSAAPSSEVQYYDYYDYINSEVDYFLDETIGQLRRGGINDINNITQSDIDSFDFEDLPWQASSTQDILLAALNDSETGTISLRDVENNIESSIRDSLYDLPINDLFYGEDIYSDGDQGYYVLERRNQIEGFSQPDQYESTSDFENFEENLTDDDHKTVVNKYKELNKVFKKMRPDAEVVTDDNGMQWLETKLTPEDANNPVIAFQEEGGNIKGAVDFSNDNKASVYMFNGADVSSLAHEMSGHLSRRFLEQLSNVDEDFASDYEKAKKWAGVKDNQWTIAAEEKWARGFERYLRDGKAPTKALKSVFDNLREWLKNIYKYIKGSSIDIELTPEITRVFDNLLGARSEDVGIKELPGYDRMMGEVEGIVDKSFKRGVSYMQTMDNAIQYMSKSKVYEDATDIQREAMVREVRKMFKQKEKKAPTAQKILGQEPIKTTVVIDEAKEINKRLKALEAAEQTGKKIGYKQGLKEAEDVKKEVLDYVKSLKVNNKISGPQYKAIINAINTNLRNPAIRKRAEKRIENIINKANYADQLDRAGKLNKAIRKAAKSKTLPANISSMAKRFAKVNPNTVDNIEEYIDMANIVYASVSKPIRVIAEEAMVNEYSDMKIKEALDMQKKALLDEYNYLVDAGLIEPGMSMEDIQQYILDVEGKKIEAKKDEEQKIRKRLNSLFDVLSGGANVILEDGINPFTGEEVELAADDRQLLKEFIAMDLNKLPIASAYRAQEALMNYIVNGKKFGMRGILARYQGEQNVKLAINEGLKAGDFRWIVGGSWWGSKKWAKESEQIRGLFTWLWRGETRGREIMKLMGVEDFLSQSADAKEQRLIKEQEYIAKFLKTKPNNKRFNSIFNTYERLVYGYLSRTVDGSAEEKQKEFKRRQKILGQVVQALEQSRNKDLIEEGKVLDKVFNKVKNSKNVDEIQDKFDKINKEAVKFVSEMFDENYDFVEGVAEGIYNLVLNKDEFYTPDMMRSIVDRDINVAESKITVDLPYDKLNTKPAGTMLENQRIDNLPGYDVENNDASNVEKILRLDFDTSVFNAFEKSLVDAYTAESVQKYSAFVNSKDFRKLFDSAKDEALFKEIMNYYINNERGKIAYNSDLKAVENFSNRFKTLSTYRALGSATAVIKQAISSIVNTSINLGKDPNALSEARKALFANPINKEAVENQIAAQEFINEYGGEINLRGPESTADIKSAEKLIRESKYQPIYDVLDIHDKLGRLQMKSLNKGDVPMARASWIGYYVHSLKNQGKPHTNINWKTEKPNKEAIAYANHQVSINQNASMSSTMGKAFTSKNPATRLFMAWVMPFSSFLFNAKSRMKTDVTILTSKLSTAEDKKIAGISLVATLAELPMYIAVQTGINYGLVSLANAFLGYDEDEEDEKLRLKRYSELAITRIITDLLSPAPNVGDVATIAAFNLLLEKAQEDPDMTNEEKKMDVYKLFESKPESMVGAMLELIAQPFASTGRRAYDVYTTLDMINGDYYVTASGKEIEFTPEDKKMLNVAATMQIMGSLNLLPSEAESLAKKMVKTIEKRAKE